MMNDMLHDPEMDQLIDNLHDQAGGIFNQIVTSNQEPPSTETIYKDLPIPNFEEDGYKELPIYVQNLKELTGNEDDDLTRKELFLGKEFQEMLTYMLEDTIFNLVEEATFEEFDLTQAPKIYIRKD